MENEKTQGREKGNENSSLYLVASFFHFLYPYLKMGLPLIPYIDFHGIQYPFFILSPHITTHHRTSLHFQHPPLNSVTKCQPPPLPPSSPLMWLPASGDSIDDLLSATTNSHGDGRQPR
ncbi:hypothetical protein RND81_01G036800 [Saponaria officinalis]|uniref:Uncharacterized protein n=1 Tax=Saponaria officinalis TaxID=3572 RepID=A0AAW1N5I8_SAPOF